MVFGLWYLNTQKKIIDFQIIHDHNESRNLQITL